MNFKRVGNFVPECPRVVSTQVKFDVISCNINVALGATTKLKHLPDVLLRCVLSFHLIRPKISGFWSLLFFRSRSIFRAAKTENPVSGHAGYKLEETAEIQCINNPEAKNSSALFQCRFFLENQSEFICNY